MCGSFRDVASVMLSWGGEYVVWRRAGVRVLVGCIASSRMCPVRRVAVHPVLSLCFGCAHVCCVCDDVGGAPCCAARGVLV